MALARFFSKTALAASHILRGFDQRAFEETLAARTVDIFFDGTAESTCEGRWTLELSVNLLARLYPALSITSSNRSGLVEQLVKRALAINPRIDIVERRVDCLCLVVGKTVPPSASVAVFVGSNSWLTKVSTRGPIGSENTNVPFGADAAACLGVANLFRATFANQLEDGRCDESWQMSLLDCDPACTAPSSPVLGNVDFGETHLVGLGAIGNGCIWSLSRLNNIHGTLHVIDHETIEISNLQRYVLTVDASEGVSKVDLAKSFLTATGLRVQEHACRWSRYLQKRNDWMLRRVAVAVDSAKDRQAIQASLPEWLVNAWTQMGDLGVSRHRFIGDQACLACLYLPTGPKKNEDELVASAIGLASEVLEVRRLLVTGEGLSRPFLEKVASALKADAAQLLSFEGRSLHTFYSEAVCGGALLRLGVDPDSQRLVEVPMAFQSALAGILLAAELVAKAGGLKECPPLVTSKLDLLRPLGPFVSMPAPKHAGGNCICQDADFSEVFRHKYGAAERG